ncbi:MAG: efflux RND transporter permease subunit, partial [Pseudomonadota bacterium]
MINFFLQEKRLTLMISLIIVVAGIFCIKLSRREAFPSIDFGAAIITTVYPGATPEDVEELVTQKIEDEIRGIDGLKDVISSSQNGLSVLSIRVDIDNADVKEVMDELQRAVDRVTDLPLDVEDRPIFTEIKTKNIPLIEISISDNVDEHKLREIADQLQDSLEACPGVAKVTKLGYRDREFRVYLDPKKMEEEHISFQEVVEAINAKNVDLPGGIFEGRPYEMTIRTSGELKDTDELRGTVIRSNLSGSNVLLKDIATVDDDFEEPEMLMRADSKKSIMLVIMKKERADTIEVVGEIRDVLKEYKKNKTYENIAFTESNDFAKYTSRRLQIVKSNGLIGFILVLICLVLFLHWRTALAAALSMPLIILATITCMVIFNITINLISMLALIIVLGMLVDNSIVVAENIHRYQEEGMSNEEAALKGSRMIFWALVATVTTTVSAFAPLVVTKGLIGNFIWSIPVLVSTALVLSLGESFLLLPTRILLITEHKKENAGRHWFVHVRTYFEKWIDVFIRNKWKTLLLALIITMTALIWAKYKMDFILFPPEGVDRIFINFEAETGTPIEAMHEAIRDVEDEILKLPKSELNALITKTGKQERGVADAHSKSRTNIGMMTIYLTDEIDRDRTANEIIKDLKKKIQFKLPITKVQFVEEAYGPPVGRAVTLTV